ncbi:Rrf2 family protein [Desulfohalotomaculum tongense]|uniref:RrF2 family transcriptional regulator n=1 Tax=Desulforadius tongensis TaxID=1216062 RepID=UPI0019566AA6|nr:Rrf2 family transcriptional regulator [Desulforadius tongensis]MBM7854848.1 Rrf2 family protein [Desulforadius tongensis]
MRFNQATDYAFRIVYYLGKQKPGEIIEARQIAEKENIPIRFLLKTIRSLTKAGIVKSYRGLKGGYTLAKDTRDITLKDVSEAVEGPVKINRCLVNPAECNKNATAWCPIHRALRNVQQATNKELEKYNFFDLIKFNNDNSDR